MPQDNPFPNLGGLTFSEDVFYRILDDLLAVGVVGATDYQVIQNHLGANMSVDVQPGSAYVAFTSVAGGKRRTRLPAQSNSGTPGSPNSADKWLTTFVAADVTNPRIDRVVLTVRDTSLDGSGASDSALRVIAGTPTAGATTTNLNGAAAVPANSILLANVLIPANATTVITANIADVRTVSRIGGNLLGGQKITTSSLSGGPPASPADTDIWIATGVDVNGTRWMFQYNAGSASTYKWEFIGGGPLYKIASASPLATITSAGWTKLISFTGLRAGEYRILSRMVATKVATSSSVSLNNSVDNGLSVVSSSVYSDWTAVGVGQQITMQHDLLATTTTGELDAYGSSGDGNGATVQIASIEATPRRIS